MTICTMGACGNGGNELREASTCAIGKSRLQDGGYKMAVTRRSRRDFRIAGVGAISESRDVLGNRGYKIVVTRRSRRDFRIAGVGAISESRDV